MFEYPVIAGERLAPGQIVVIRADGKAYAWNGDGIGAGVVPHDVPKNCKFTPATHLELSVHSSTEDADEPLVIE